MTLDADARKRLEDVADEFEQSNCPAYQQLIAADIRALLSELDRLQGGEGWVLVPREPGIGELFSIGRVLIEHGCCSLDGASNIAAECYKAALVSLPDEPG